MDKEKIVSLELLERSIEIIFKHLREQGVTELPLEKDFYWEIVKSEVKYNPDQNKDALVFDLGAGHLHKDLESLQALEGGNVTSSHLMSLSALLRYVGERQEG